MRSKLEELEKLVSELYDDGLSDAAMARLEELLLDDEELQDRYCSLVNTHMALSVAGASSIENAKPHGQPSEAVPTSPGEPQRTSSLKKHSEYKYKFWSVAAVAAALLISAFSWFQWTDAQRPQASAPAFPPAANSWSSGVSSLPTITNVTWEGPNFASNSDYWQPVAAVSGGAISLQQDQGEAADGYLFCLQPGMSVELIASCDATGQNSLSITEITYDAKPSTKKLTFHNKGDGKGPKPLHANPHAKHRRYGVLGRWSEINATARPRYFLLTGVHKLVDLFPDDQWRVSEMGVLLETNSVIHVGWDDSGPAPVERGEPYQQDLDYDDLAATLLFTPIGGFATEQSGEVVVVAPHQVPQLKLPPEGVEGLDFELVPGATAVVKAISDATDPNALAVIDPATNEVLWSSSKTSSSYLGTTALQNTSEETRQLRMVGLNIPRSIAEESREWIPSQWQVSYSQSNFFIVGFEDSRNDGDFNDIRASLLLEPGASDEAESSDDE